jgi:Uma2 family endonuclease
LPDVCVLLAAPQTKYLLDSAFLVVEVLSEGDVMSSVIEKLKEYSAKGVNNIWLIDPRLELLYSYSPP